MTQLNFHKPLTPPQRSTLPVKIDSLFIETTEAIVIASYLTSKEKIPFVRKASTKLDLLKFFLQVAWEIKALDNKKYIALSERVDEIGKMLGGWIKQLLKRTSAQKAEE